MFYNPKFCQMLEAGAQILGNTHLVIERINHQEVSVERFHALVAKSD